MSKRIFLFDNHPYANERFLLKLFNKHEIAIITRILYFSSVRVCSANSVWNSVFVWQSVPDTCHSRRCTCVAACAPTAGRSRMHTADRHGHINTRGILSVWGDVLVILMASKTNGVESEWARAPPAPRPLGERILRILYNPDEKTFLGRTLRRWGEFIDVFSQNIHCSSICDSYHRKEMHYNRCKQREIC